MCAADELERTITLLRTLEHEAAAAGHRGRALQIELLAEDYEAELARSTTRSRSVEDTGLDERLDLVRVGAGPDEDHRHL
jgi:hypothetical protein